MLSRTRHKRKRVVDELIDRTAETEGPGDEDTQMIDSDSSGSDDDSDDSGATKRARLAAPVKDKPASDESSASSSSSVPAGTVVASAGPSAPTASVSGVESMDLSGVLAMQRGYYANYINVDRKENSKIVEEHLHSSDSPYIFFSVADPHAATNTLGVRGGSFNAGRAKKPMFTLYNKRTGQSVSFVGPPSKVYDIADVCNGDFGQERVVGGQKQEITEYAKYWLDFRGDPYNPALVDALGRDKYYGSFLRRLDDVADFLCASIAATPELLSMIWDDDKVKVNETLTVAERAEKIKAAARFPHWARPAGVIFRSETRVFRNVSKTADSGAAQVDPDVPAQVYAKESAKYEYVHLPAFVPERGSDTRFDLKPMPVGKVVKVLDRNAVVAPEFHLFINAKPGADKDGKTISLKSTAKLDRAIYLGRLRGEPPPPPSGHSMSVTVHDAAMAAHLANLA